MPHRAFTVFSGLHYKVYIFLEGIGWIECNGSAVHMVGSWVEVVKMYESGLLVF